MSVGLDSFDRRAIAASLSANGFWRRSPWLHGGRAGHREWLHFTIHGDALTLVVNLSIADDLRPAAEVRRERARVLVLARDAAGWDGESEEVGGHAAWGGQLRARFGGIEVEVSAETIQIRGRLQRRPIELDLEFAPMAFPSLATNVALGAGPPINWLVVPRLVASGRAMIGGQVHLLDRLPAYHDHNWGHFSQRDLAWQWGHACTTDAPYSIVLARLLDSAHATTFMQALLVWCGPRQHRVFRGAELAVHGEGFLRPDRPFTVPRSAALLAGNTATEVPRRFHFIASADSDTLDGVFDAEAVARVVVPHDHDLGTTIVHEVVGTLRLHGRVRGARIELVAPAMFEFLRGVA